MARPATVDSDAIIAAVRGGQIAAEVGRQFGITRARVSQIIKEKAPELMVKKGGVASTSDPVKVEARRAKARAETLKVMKEEPNKVFAADALGLSVSGLNSRLRRLQIKDTLTRTNQEKRQIAATKRALKASKTKTEAADLLGLTVSGLESRMKRWGIDG